MNSNSGRRVVVLLSGTGRSLQNLFDAQAEGQLDAEFVHVISNRRDAKGLEVAQAAGVSTSVVERKAHADLAGFSDAITEIIEAQQADLVVMAGFLAFYRLPDQLIGRVINIHPSLLPQFGGKGFYGHHVHEAVVESGVRISGCTVHFVDNVYDHGAPILQLSCPVLPGDDADRLAARVFARECEALPRVIGWYLDGRVRLLEGKILVQGDFSVQDLI